MRLSKTRDFIVLGLGELARSTQPGKGSLHNPAPLKMRCWQRLIVCTSQPNMLSAQVHEQPHQQSPGSHPVLNASRVHHHGQQQPQCVYGYVALTLFDSFACVISALPPFETVLTDWESMMTTLSLARLPALACTCWRSSASTRRADASGQRCYRPISRAESPWVARAIDIDSLWFDRPWFAYGRWR